MYIVLNSECRFFFYSYELLLLGLFKKRRIWDLEEKRGGKCPAEWKWSFSVNSVERKPGEINLPTTILCPWGELRVIALHLEEHPITQTVSNRFMKASLGH